MTRRDFFRSSACATGGLSLVTPPEASSVNAEASTPISLAQPSCDSPLSPLEPARWIWCESRRCLANTAVFFRREISLSAPPTRATGWIMAESRYLLDVNGERAQEGPAPSDPRWPEIDPLDLTMHLRVGANVIGATVLYYGHGDSNWVAGKPGFLFWMQLEFADGNRLLVVSDNNWRVCVARAWKPGMYQRWFTKALQEIFDARKYPYGWTTAAYRPGSAWRPAMVLDGSPNKPAVCTSYPDYVNDISGDVSSGMKLCGRSIPLLRKEDTPAKQLAVCGWIEWKCSPREYFERFMPDAYTEERDTSASKTADGAWEVVLDRTRRNRSAALTFELAEQVVGYPYFEIEAPAGTIVELLTQEAHDTQKALLLNTPFYSWARIICREGTTTFTAFNLESCRWVQLLIRGRSGIAIVRKVGVRRSLYPWPVEPRVSCSDPALQQLMCACVNTLKNSTAKGTFVDGEAREGQPYSGDGSHQMHAVYLAFGETRLQTRFVKMFGKGQTAEGYFLDCWPAPDRLKRLWERELQLTPWGPLLDHGIGFNFDCWHHYMYTGDLKPLAEHYPRLLRFVKYLQGIVGSDGLLPVENLGIPSVWIDHEAYRQQRHKQCAFNLYTAAMCVYALAPLCRAFGDRANEHAISAFGRGLREAAIRRFWSPQHGLFVNNLPWRSEEGGIRLCDRSLATSILFDQCPQGQTDAALDTLVRCPQEMGCSYPANACWSQWALAKGGRTDVVLNEWRSHWVTMPSVALNNTIGEQWVTAPDSTDQWSHCGIVPLYALFMSIAGIRPLAPGFAVCEIRPQPADLERLALTAHTVRGPVEFASDGKRGDRHITIALPPRCEGRLVVRREERLRLPLHRERLPVGLSIYCLPSGHTTEVHLRYT